MGGEAGVGRVGLVVVVEVEADVVAGAVTVTTAGEEDIRPSRNAMARRATPRPLASAITSR